VGFDAEVAQLPVLASRMPAIPPLIVIGLLCRYPGLPDFPLAGAMLIDTVTVSCAFRVADGFVDGEAMFGLWSTYPPLLYPKTALMDSPVSTF
jgi:hypothetical protein